MTPRFTHLPAPAYCPDPDPDYPLNEGREIARTARLMGGVLQPWQRLVVNRATQYRWGVNLAGRRVRQYRYRTVLVSVPRQSGKTWLTGPVQLHRILTRPGISTFFTAQTGHDAGKRMRELIAAVVSSPAGALVVPRFSNGSEGLTVPGTGSSLARFSPTPSSIHGDHPYLVTLDEIWKHSASLGQALLGAITPSQVTIRSEAQIWMISTKGTAQSDFMNDWLDRGHKGQDPYLCLVEFSMPEGMDPYDPATWWAFHPALGNTITPEALASDTSLPYAEWMRAYMNTLTAAENPVIAIEDWDHLAGQPDQVPDLGDLAVAYEVAPDSSCSAVVTAWQDEDLTYVRVLHQAPGTAWLPGYVRRLAGRWPGIRWVADGAGPARRVTDELTGDADQPLRVRALSYAERGIADGNLLDAILQTGTLRHDGSEVMRVAIANVALRTTNGVRLIDRDRSTAPVPSVIAASLAAWGATHLTGPVFVGL